jgi:hypothetical protein
MQLFDVHLVHFGWCSRQQALNCSPTTSCGNDTKTFIDRETIRNEKILLVNFRYAS